MSDGKLHIKEGEAIKSWIKKNIATLDRKNKELYKINERKRMGSDISNSYKRFRLLFANRRLAQSTGR